MTDDTRTKFEQDNRIGDLDVREMVNAYLDLHDQGDLTAEQVIACMSIDLGRKEPSPQAKAISTAFAIEDEAARIAALKAIIDAGPLPAGYTMTWTCPECGREDIPESDFECPTCDTPNPSVVYVTAGKED